MTGGKELLTKNKLTISLMVILAIQCALIAFANMTLISQNIDCDVAKLYVHAAEIWKSHRLLVPGWSYLTTLELDCPLLFALPFYGLTGNVFLAFGISNLIFLVMYLLILHYMFQGWGNAVLLSANLIFIPYGIGQLSYFNMMFFNGGQYSMKVLIPLMLIALLTRMDRADGKRGKGKFLVCSGGYFFFLFISSFSSGIYVFICGIFPILSGYMLLCKYNRKKISKSFVWYAGGTLLDVLTGCLLNFALSLGARGNGMTLCSVMDDELRDNLFACFFGIFEVLGGGWHIQRYGSCL